MAITYDYYRIFYHVAQCRSFTRAAEVLSNNQPNIMNDNAAASDKKQSSPGRKSFGI